MLTVRNIQPIQTRWNQTIYRSRLEARWAVFFDTLKIKYEYEPQGFDLSKIPHVEEFLAPADRYYLPDFYLPNLGCYMEIKPLMMPVDDVAIAKCFLLAQEENVMITYGSPGWNSYRIVACKDGEERPHFWSHEHIELGYEAARSARF